MARLFATNIWAAYDAFLTPMRQNIAKQEAIIKGAGTPEEKEKASAVIQGFGAGFCLGGHCLPSREPEAYSIFLTPLLKNAPVPNKVAMGSVLFWGFNRFIYQALGMEGKVRDQILDSKKWTGTEQELRDIFAKQSTPFTLPLPLRETVDLVHAMLHMTIKLMKFTSLPPICGGHIEIATVTTDRGFRWIRHKTLGAALDHP